MSVALIAATPVSPPLAVSPADFMKMAVAEREALKSMEMRAEIHRDVFIADAEGGEVLEGATFIYHFWLSDDVNRVDCVETRPGDPSNAAFQKFARAGGVLRTVPGRGNVMFSEYQTGQTVGSHWIEKDLAIDPRLIGFWPDHFELLKHFSPEELFGLCSGDGISTELTQNEYGFLLKGRTTSGQDLSWRFQFDRILNVPTGVSLFGFSGHGTQDAIETTWATIDNVVVPVTAEFRRYDNGQLVRSESWNMSWIAVNQPIDSSVATWVSLGISDGDVVQFGGDDSAEYRQWFNGAFTQWQPIPLLPPASMHNALNETDGSGRRLLVAANLLVFGVLLLWVAGRRLFRRPL